MGNQCGTMFETNILSNMISNSGEIAQLSGDLYQDDFAAVPGVDFQCPGLHQHGLNEGVNSDALCNKYCQPKIESKSCGLKNGFSKSVPAALNVTELICSYFIF